MSILPIHIVRGKKAQMKTNNEIQGRSVYICKNKDCIEKAFKKNRIEVLLKSKLPEDVKIDLYTVLKK